MGEDGELHCVELSAEGAVRVWAYRHANVTTFCQTSLTTGLHQDGADGGNRSKSCTKYNTFQKSAQEIKNHIHRSKNCWNKDLNW